jgi:ribonucleoside-diphosphate reductase beta chain
MSVFNVNKTDTVLQPMFFGDTLNIARYDIQKYAKFEQLTDKQHGFFWRPTEINVSKDITDFKNLTEVEKHIFIKNIAYQTMLDSVQTRAPFLAFLPFVSLPELEVCITTWAFFESIHSRSYSYILQNLYSDPSIVFSTIIDDENILNRAKTVIKFYDDFVEYSDWYKLFGFGTFTVSDSESLTVKTVTITQKELYTKLYLALISVYVLESIRFYVSFACSFAFGQLGKMTGNAKIIKLIARDEAQHVAITTNIIRNFQRGKEGDYWVQITEECHDTAIGIFEQAVDQESEWAKYLFKDGSIVGLNDTLLTMYLKHTAQKRMRNIGLKGNYNVPTNPLGWMNDWLDSGDEQYAPQETENPNYIVGGINNNIDNSVFGEFSL